MRTFIWTAGLVAVLALAGVVLAEKPLEQQAHFHTPDTIQWQAGPKMLPAGAQLAILDGDPMHEGPFVMRVKMPDGYIVPPHIHLRDERVTVIAGTLHLGMGEKFDKNDGHAMPAGSYGMWPGGMKHFAWAEGETVIQIHGMGPWSIQYLDEADDPRNKK